MSRAMLIALTGLLALTTGCKKSVRDRLYYTDLKPPLGVGKVEMASDVSLNKPTGGEITVLTVVEPEVDRDELDRLQKSFFRQVKLRRGFARGDRPERIDLRFYTTKQAAEAGGDDWLARVECASSAAEPTYVNKQKPPLLKWVKNALKPTMALFAGDLKPQILADPIKLEVEITWPFVSDDGSGKYVEKLSYANATQTFYSTTREIFEKIPDLKKVTFIGKHEDQVVMKIWLSRDQYTALNMTHVQIGRAHV